MFWVVCNKLASLQFHLSTINDNSAFDIDHILFLVQLFIYPVFRIAVNHNVVFQWSASAFFDSSLYGRFETGTLSQVRSLILKPADMQLYVIRCLIDTNR